MKIQVASLLLLLFSVLPIHGDDHPSAVEGSSSAASRRPSTDYDLMMMNFGTQLISMMTDELLHGLNPVENMKDKQGKHYNDSQITQLESNLPGHIEEGEYKLPAPAKPIQADKQEQEKDELQTLPPGQRLTANLAGLEHTTFDKQSPPPNQTRVKRGSDKKWKHTKVQKNKKLGKKWQHEESKAEATTGDEADAQDARKTGWKKWFSFGKKTKDNAGDSNAAPNDRRNGWKKWNRKGNADGGNGENLEENTNESNVDQQGIDNDISNENTKDISDEAALEVEQNEEMI